MEEWKTLFPDGGNDYGTLAKDPSGDEALIYQELNSLVDKYFKKYYSAPEFIEECRGDLKDADSSKNWFLMNLQMLFILQVLKQIVISYTILI